MQYYILIILGIIIIPLIAEFYIRSTYNKYLKINSINNMSGFEIARKILDSNGLEDIHIVKTYGLLSDHYDPSRNVIRFSDAVFDECTITSASIAAHECGHAIQKKEGFTFMKIRTFLVPIVNISNKFSYILLIIGFMLQLANLVEIAIILMTAGIVFQLVTLPVEFNASSKAKNELLRLNLLTNAEIDGTRSVLNATAMTYVAGLIANLLELLRLILIFNNRK